MTHTQATVSPAVPPYPLRLEGRLEQPSRWLWLVKWLLVIPHYVVLALLWIAFTLLSVIAFVAVLFTGRYPREIFGFNAGVLRWSWRVAFYAFGANGTDRYPPFTLADVPEYPARLEIAYPEQQRKGLPLLGWWLAGIPQYLIAGVFLGGGPGWTAGHWGAGWAGLIGLLVFVAVVVLLVRGAYPRSIFDLVLGLNRWVLRTVAYAAVMTPEYPPFRVDAGETEPGGMTIGASAQLRPAAGETQSSWGAGRVFLLVGGSLAALAGIAAIAGGGTAVVIDQTQRDASGYLTTDSRHYRTSTYALVSDGYRTGAAGDLLAPVGALGRIRIRFESARPVFVGIAPADALAGYLGGVRREVATRLDAARSSFRMLGASPPASPPASRSFWTASTSGTSTRTLTWLPRSGTWRVVVMNADASRGVETDLSIGARVPALLWLGIGFLGGGALVLVIGGGLVSAAVRRRAG